MSDAPVTLTLGAMRVLLQYDEDNLSVIDAKIDGPVGTPFTEGEFRVRLNLPGDYPASPPKGFFLTKIFHPNVAPASGEICVNTLKRDWNSTLGIQHVLQVIRCLLIQPNPESALNEDAGKLLLENYEDYCKRAALITRVHARKQPSANSTAAAGDATTTSAAAAPSNGTGEVNKENSPKKRAVDAVTGSSTAPAVGSKASQSKPADKSKKALKRL